ncbi:MAG: NUDIX hydrolase [Bacteroidales bacterium]|nr:NUDIX hydrolase [Bacteroidales bacterium]MDD3859233.1 NUDIX hydrolase [Bacteroidales bacterium]
MNYTYDYPRALNTVDAIIIDDKTRSKILLIKRANEPYKNCWALPGGFIEMDETLEQSVNRETAEETSLAGIKFHQFKAYGNPGRDPRDRNIAVVFYGYCNTPEKISAGDDAKEISWFNLDNLPEVAFDHKQIISEFIAEKLCNL